ncbi:MAG: hypothetical protein V4717_19840 [Bacteroidota bacterium]
MHNDLLDILSRKVQPISNEQLVKYLTGELSDAEKHNIEESLLNNNIEAEAIEGLQLVKNQEKIQQYQLEIQKSLREKLQQKSVKRKRNKQVQLSYLLLMTGALLAFILLIWLVFYFLQHN